MRAGWWCWSIESCPGRDARSRARIQYGVRSEDLTPFARNGGQVIRPDPVFPRSSGRRGRAGGVAQADVQLAQLLLVDEARGAGEQVLRALRLREGDDVADRLGARHHRDDAVEAEREAAVRRCAVLERVEQ